MKPTVLAIGLDSAEPSQIESWADEGDLAPTILDMLNAPIPDHLEGALLAKAAGTRAAG